MKRWISLVAGLMCGFALITGCATSPEGPRDDLAASRLAIQVTTLELVQDNPELAQDVVDAVNHLLENTPDNSLLLLDLIRAELPEDMEPSKKLLVEELASLVVGTALNKVPDLSEVEALKMVLGWVRDAAKTVPQE